MWDQQISISMEKAEEVAILALNFMSADVELMGRFLTLSGLDVTNLRDVAGEPAFLAATLDFLLQDDSLLLAFAGNNNLDPNQIVAAKSRLDPMSMSTTGSF